MSEVVPHLATVADDIAVIRSMYTDQFNHARRSCSSTLARHAWDAPA